MMQMDAKAEMQKLLLTDSSEGSEHSEELLSSDYESDTEEFVHLPTKRFKRESWNLQLIFLSIVFKLSA